MDPHRSPDPAGGARASRNTARRRSPERSAPAHPAPRQRSAAAATSTSAPRHAAGAPANATAVADERESLSASLARRCPEVALLHDRRAPGIAAPVGLIAVAESGVHVIATRWPADVERQVRAVAESLAPSEPDASVRGCVCAGLPAPGAAATIPTAASVGFPILDPRALASRLTSPGPLSGGRIERIARLLDERFPPA